MRFVQLLSILLICLSQTSDAQQRGNALIRGGTVLTVTSGTLENTDILVRDGRIDRIGSGLTAPAGFEIIDARGRYVMPGIIDAHAHIAISEVNELTNPVTAEVSVGDVINPYDINIYRATAGGVTISHVMHGSANVIGGRNATIKHRYGERDPSALRMEGAPETIKFALGENPTRVHGRGNQIVPATRMGVEFVLREAFMQAQRYRADWERYDVERRRNDRAVPPVYSERLEMIGRILDGDLMIHAHSYRADEILMLLDVVRDFGIETVVFQHVNEGFKVAPELAAYGAMASVFSDWWSFKFEVYYSTAYNAAILARNGVVTSINSDSPEVNRHLYHEAAKTQKYGNLSDEEALALITINPARQLGIADRVGSIEVGKDADIVIFDAHPLSIYAIPEVTLVDGIVRFDRERDTDDMRLLVDPAQRIDETQIAFDEHERCMQGVNLYEFASQAIAN
jgi:imidazolonepropionase-like amidohydrolase